MGGRAAELRLARPEGLHLTLFFAGELSSGAAGAWADELERSVADAPAPRLRLAPPGAFPSRGRARVLWLGVEERGASGALAELRGRVARAAGRAGLADPAGPRPFRPHVTLARSRGAPLRRLPAEVWDELSDLAWTPDAVRLLRTRPEPGGARYEELRRFPLAPADSPGAET